MPTTTIEIKHIHSGILAGAQNIYNNREILNNANGFPVPDRDTGNNLAYLMQHVIHDCQATHTIYDLLQQIGNISIRNARGNSGAIFSQFFNGMSKRAPKQAYISLEELSLCFDDAYQHAYQAIQSPVEGTIITAIRSWATHLNQFVTEYSSVSATFKTAFEHLKQTVEQTRYTLRQQKKLQVADAGAMAFLYFIEGFIASVIDRINHYPTNIIADQALQIDDAHHHIDENESITQRYCTEVLLKKSNGFDRLLLEQQLNTLGDSMVITENDTLLRIHIHSNTPSRVVMAMQRFGDIIETKADDMRMQHMLSMDHTDQYALIVDSIADFPIETAPDHVYCLPVNLMVDNVSYADKITTYPDLINEKNVSSAQPNKQQVAAFLTPIIQRYNGVIIITASSKMSGIYDRFSEVIADIDCAKPIYLVDSKANSVAEGLIAQTAVRAMVNGMAIHQLYQLLLTTVKRTKIYVSVLNLKAMVASGRLNSKLGAILQKIHFLPLISIDKAGEGRIKGVAFSNHQNRKLLLKTIERYKQSIADFAIVHAANPEGAKELAHQVSKIVTKEPLYVEAISTVVMRHAGLGSLAVGFITKED